MRGLTAFFRSDFERLIELTDRALAINPNHALALNARGLVHTYSGDPAQAMPYIERAMRLDPAFRQQYLHYLATAHYVAGDYESAAAMFEERTRLYPKTDLSRGFLAATLAHLDRLEEAREVWRKLMDINPNYSAEAHIGRLPFADPAIAETFINDLRGAGLIGDST